MKGITDTFFSDKTIFSNAINAYIPGTAYVPLPLSSMHESSYAISPGDSVTEGQIIARGRNSNAAAIHSPIPGVVENFVSCLMPDGKPGLAAKIKLSGAFSYLGKPVIKSDWELLTKTQLCRMLAEKGILNLFSEPVSLAEKIVGLKKRKDRILVIRLNDEDPSQKTDSFIAHRYQTEIAEGAAVLVKAANIEGVALLYDKNGQAPDREEFSSQIHPAEIELVPVVPHRYFAGTMNEIVTAIRHIHPGSIFDSITRTDLFVDATTLLNVYRAAVFSLPVMESMVHISGSVIKSPGIFSIRTGTLICDIVDECGGFIEPSSIVVINGVVIGMSITALDTPVTKQVKSIRFLHRRELPDQNAYECIRCGNCKTICPNQLEPAVFFAHISGIEIMDTAYIASATLCENCALCNTVCPSRLPLCQYTTLLKEAVLREKK
jgi:electron transport complex protein RnfC